MNYKFLKKAGELIEIIKCIDVRRGWNVLLIVFSYLMSRITGRIVQMGLPFGISVEPTTSCNLSCRECPSGLRSFSRPTGQLEFQDFKSLIDQVRDHVIYLMLYFQGEPYMNKDFFRMIDYAKRNRIFTSTSTNGHFLDAEKARNTVESNLDRIIISLDGLDQQTYEKYRVGGRLDKVIEGINNLVSWREKLKSSKPFIILQFLVMRHNEHQLHDARSWGRKLGADYVQLKTTQLCNPSLKKHLLPVNEKYSRYYQDGNGGVSIKSKLKNHCFRMWSSCVVTWDGRVVPCCFDKDASHQLGYIEEQSFREIWKDNEYQKFRKEVFTNRREIGICQNCTQGLKILDI